jgi:hypothetical protein
LSLSLPVADAAYNFVVVVVLCCCCRFLSFDVCFFVTLVIHSFNYFGLLLRCFGSLAA